MARYMKDRFVFFGIPSPRRRALQRPVLGRWQPDPDSSPSSTARGAMSNYCARRAGDTDVFVRKATGWALREYAKTDPGGVRAFTATTELSPLSRREALRRIT